MRFGRGRENEEFCLGQVKYDFPETSKWRFQIDTRIYDCRAPEKAGLEMQSHQLLCPLLLDQKKKKIFLDSKEF